MTSFPPHLVREDLRDFTGYSSARTSHRGAPARVWLNANEAASASAVDAPGALRRYPDPQPAPLVGALAGLYGVPTEQVVVGRGSDEAIELLVRALCRPGADGIVVAPPTFGMYAVSARLHGVPVHQVPQIDHGTRFAVDAAEVARTTENTSSRLVFLASPGNPTGATVPATETARLAGALADTAVVVLDEAYQEFADGPSALALLPDHPNLVVLRTLSKAHALAGARVGVAIGHPDLVGVLRRVQAPYPVPEPVARLALAALEPGVLAGTRSRVAATLAGRDRLRDVLAGTDLVRTAYEGQGNFVLVRSDDPDELLARLARTGIIVRDMRHLPGLADAVRITVGTAAELAELATALHPETPRNR